MPHHENVRVDGVLIPSVNEVTDLIPKPWLEKWQRKLIKKHGYEGLVMADNIKETKAQFGTDRHHDLEMYLKHGTVPPEGHPGHVPVLELQRWIAENRVEIFPDLIERHLISREYLFHGSPDFICKYRGEWLVPDFKFKGSKPIDYKTKLNETGYAVAAQPIIGALPLKICILGFNTTTGKLVKDNVIAIKSEWWDDFMTLRRAWPVANRAVAHDDANYYRGA